MMMPMGMSLVLLYEELNEKTRLAGGHVDARAPNFALTLLLGIAYSASIGGVATLIGTPPNGVLVTQMGQIFPEAPEFAFMTWIVFCAAHESGLSIHQLGFAYALRVPTACHYTF